VRMEHGVSMEMEKEKKKKREGGVTAGEKS
jgi:hypothetical protein